MPLKILRFRKRPVGVEAVRLQRDGVIKIADWCKGTLIKNAAGRRISFIIITTVDGERQQVKFGDWIIKEKNGFTSYKPDIFEKTYEPITDEIECRLCGGPVLVTPGHYMMVFGQGDGPHKGKTWYLCSACGNMVC